jgi:hypothetical protein
VILLRREGFACSASTVGKILKKPKGRGVLNEPSPNHISGRKSQRQRPYAVRKPKDYVAREPGDIVELSHLYCHRAYPTLTDMWKELRGLK